VKRTKLAAAAAAVAITFGAGVGIAPPASAADNIKVFGEQERLNGPNGFPYIGYVVDDFGPSNDPVPHRGKLFSANLWVDGFGTNTNPMIERFGARTIKGIFYPAIQGASNMNKLYFDVTGPEPNSVVWNDGVRDILAWVPGEVPLEGFWDKPDPPPPPPPPLPGMENSQVVPNAAAGSMPAESDPALVATPNDLAPPPFQLTEAEVAEPGFRG
jgi:hypothetical protein